MAASKPFLVSIILQVPINGFLACVHDVTTKRVATNIALIKVIITIERLTRLK
ncbi:hypothetical protein JCM15548_13746 [Geofilum rubicundum JCM 15548]|uniref:Uncharacterized protein n=1 Tax=Geofilum rubicundum JCM 15548 TaxID=1236989 RepID=A0A0E9M2Q2_9BACT|nr:hypothetical protein JCM15548_13746 [Geofilum rubicundum JCM 15548]